MNKIGISSIFKRANIKSNTNPVIKTRKSPSVVNLKKRNFEIINKNIIKEQDEIYDRKKSYKKKTGRKSAFNILPLKNLLAKNNLNDLKMNRDFILNILKKNPKNRRENEIKIVANFLCEKYQYFSNIKKSDSQLKVEKLVEVAKIVQFDPGEMIIRYGDPGDKFYIVIEGSVTVYKPIFVGVKITPNDFIKYMNNIKKKEKDFNKYSRIKEYNKKKNFDISEYEPIDPDMKFMRMNMNLYIENLEMMGSYGEGFSFGEISLMTNAKRNATIKSSTDPKNKCTILLYIGKDSYDKAIREYQEKKLSKDIESFIKAYPFLKVFTREQMISVFNCITKKNLEKGEYLFHQNDEDQNLYFIINGKFEVYSHISLNWINTFLEYIINMKDNILGYLYVQKIKKLNDVFNIVDKIKKKKMKSPMIFEEKDLWEKMDDKINENNLIGLKYDEEKVNENKNTYKIKIQNIDVPELLGIENSFEFKNKFYSVKCVSDKAETNYIKIMDLIKIIYNLRLKELNYLLEIVLERKNIFAKQIISSLKTLEYQIISNLEMKYEYLINTEFIDKKEEGKNENSNNENKDNRILSVIKSKGYSSGLKDILDEDGNILEKKPSEIIKSYLYRYKPPSKKEIKEGKKQELIDFIFTNKTKNFKRQKDIYKNNKENLLILKKLMKDPNKSSIKNMKKFNNTQSNISSFLLNNSTGEQSILKSIANTNRQNFINMNNEHNFSNSFLINSNYLYNKSRLSAKNLKKLKNSKTSNYLTYKGTKINNKNSYSNSVQNTGDFDDMNKNIRTNLMNINLIKDFNKTKKFFIYDKIPKKTNNNNNDFDSLNKNKNILDNTSLNKSEIKFNKILKPFKEKEKGKASNSLYYLNRTNVFGNVDKNRKDFYLGNEFSKKIVSINREKDINLLKHHFPLIRK